ncbi:MAG: hypothetical protein HKN21_03360, partial [Candidatus Eisenbacteria bacterium]|nr:hypothetical protein [Candidatus Eisenbacteria bacterium]
KAIDAMLKAQSGDGQAEADSPIQPFSVLRPSQLARWLRIPVETSLDAFAVGLSEFLSMETRGSVWVQPSSVELVYFSELTQSVGAPSATFLLDVSGGDQSGVGLFDWGLDIGSALLEKMLGGDGEPMKGSRGFTSIEQQVLSRVTTQAYAPLRDAFREMLTLATRAPEFEPSPPMLKVASPQSRYINALFSIRSGAMEGTISLGLPLACVEAALERRQKDRGTPGETDKESKSMLGSDLKHASVTVAARWKRVLLSMRQISEMKEGTVINLMQDRESPIQICVNGRAMFEGVAGQARGNMGVRITQVLSDPVPESPTSGKHGRVQ